MVERSHFRICLPLFFLVRAMRAVSAGRPAPEPGL